MISSFYFKPKYNPKILFPSQKVWDYPLYRFLIAYALHVLLLKKLFFKKINLGFNQPKIKRGFKNSISFIDIFVILTSDIPKTQKYKSHII